jgi:hypothetical protein
MTHTVTRGRVPALADNKAREAVIESVHQACGGGRSGVTTQPQAGGSVAMATCSVDPAVTTDMRTTAIARTWPDATSAVRCNAEPTTCTSSLRLVRCALSSAWSRSGCGCERRSLAGAWVWEATAKSEWSCGMLVPHWHEAGTLNNPATRKAGTSALPAMMRNRDLTMIGQRGDMELARAILTGEPRGQHTADSTSVLNTTNSAYIRPRPPQKPGDVSQQLAYSSKAASRRSSNRTAALSRSFGSGS